MTWTSVTVFGVMRTDDNLRLKTMSVEFADECDMTCEKKKWKETGVWPE